MGDGLGGRVVRLSLFFFPLRPRAFYAASNHHESPGLECTFVQWFQVFANFSRIFLRCVLKTTTISQDFLIERDGIRNVVVSEK